MTTHCDNKWHDNYTRVTYTCNREPDHPGMHRFISTVAQWRNDETPLPPDCGFGPRLEREIAAAIIESKAPLCAHCGDPVDVASIRCGYGHPSADDFMYDRMCASCDRNPHFQQYRYCVECMMGEQAGSDDAADWRASR